LSESASILELDRVTSGYAGVPIVQSVSFAIAPGESVAIVGRNGVGKTTLVKAITGLNPISAGIVRFKSVRIDSADPSRIARLGMGYVPQGRGIFARLTVAENLMMGELVGEAKAPFHHERVLGWFPVLKERLRQKAGTLSGGEQQMLSIGRVLVGGPDFLLLDEPSEGVQPSIVEQIAEVICHQIEEHGVTVLLVEQNMDLVNMVADRCIVIDNGSVVATVSPEEFADPEVAQRYLAI
jgi:urea transport system ATP-binding protein